MNWKNQIQLQISNHKQLNLLSSPKTSGFCFADRTKELMEQIRVNLFSEREEQEMLIFTAQSTLSSLFHFNQYYQFDRTAVIRLESVYWQLLLEIKMRKNNVIDFDILAERHYLRLQRWLVESHPEVSAFYPTSQPVINNGVVCAEYSVATQLHILGIESSRLTEPILDVGCGKEYHLVKYLCSKKLDAFGIDRDVIPGDRVFRMGWMEYKFQPDVWGTIISHLGFTNHFVHHYFKAKSDHLLYAKKYIELLQALKVAGKFYYAPDLPFIEQYLNPKQYLVQKKHIPQTPFYSVCIELLM